MFFYCNLKTYVIVPCWSAGASALWLKCVCKAAALAAAQSLELFTVVPCPPGTAFVTLP